MLVVGIGTDSVRLLTQIDDPDIIGRIKSQSTGQRAATFKEHLQRLTDPKTRKRTNFDNDDTVTPACKS